MSVRIPWPDGFAPARLRPLIRNSVNVLLDFVYPPLCFHCHTLLTGSERILCASCWNGITLLDPSHSTWVEIASKVCGDGLVDELVSCYLFEKEGGLQELIHLLKYEHMTSLGVLLGRDLGRRLLARSVGCSRDFTVPVPLHKRKLRERGYNQCVMLCRGISEASGLRSEANLVCRVKYTETQTQLDLEERRRNVDGAFAIPEARRSDVHGASLIIVDDVITTGSTIRACARELRKFGARRIVAASIALAQ